MSASVGVDGVLDAYDEARKYLGFDTEITPIPRDELVEQLVAEGYDRSVARDAVDMSVDRGDLVRVEETAAVVENGELVKVDDGVRPVRDEPFEDTETDENSEKEAGSSESEASNPRVSATENAALEDAADTVDETRVLEAFETCVEFYHEHLNDELHEGCDVPVETPREYVETALNHRVIPTTPHVKPYSSDRNVTVEKDEALLREIRRTYDREPSLITTKSARDKYDEAGVLDLVEGVKHHGDMKGSNDFEEERLGVIIGSRHFGDDFVKKWGAYLGDAVETPDRSKEENRGVGLSYGETGDKILRHMREHETLQGLMRFGRDGAGAVIYCHTNTLPSWYPTETETPEDDAVVRPRSEAERDVIRELRRRGEGRTAELSEAVEDVTERRVLQILNTLRSRGVVDVTGEGRGFVWHDDGLHCVNEAGDVALDAVDLDELPDEEVHEISRNSTYTASFVKTDGSRASKAGDVATDASRTPQRAGSGGEPPPD